MKNAGRDAISGKSNAANIYRKCCRSWVFRWTFSCAGQPRNSHPLTIFFFLSCCQMWLLLFEYVFSFYYQNTLSLYMASLKDIYTYIIILYCESVRLMCCNLSTDLLSVIKKIMLQLAIGGGVKLLSLCTYTFVLVDPQMLNWELLHLS